MVISYKEREEDETGQIVAFMVSSGFYPSFGPRGKEKLGKRFAFQSDPIFGASLRAMGLPHKATWAHPGGIYPAGKDFQKLLDKTSIIKDIKGRLRTKLVSDAARYTLRGNYVWWNSGVGSLDVRQLAEAVYAYMANPQNRGNTTFESGEGNKPVAEQMHDLLMKTFTNFEVSNAKKLTEDMVEAMVGSNLAEEDLLEYTKETFENALASDVPEEVMIPDKLVKGAEMLAAEDQAGNVNKTDINLKIRLAGAATKLIEMDASETLMGLGDEARQGKHGWIKAIQGIRGDYEWVRDQEDDIVAKISDHMIKAIDNDYNKVIKELVKYAADVHGLPSGQVPTIEQIMGPTGYKGGSKATTPAFFAGKAPSKSGQGVAPGQGEEFLKAVSDKHFLETNKLMQTWLDAGHKGTKGTAKGEKGEVGKVSGVMQYIFKMLSATSVSAERSLYLSQRVSRRDPETGFAYYGFIPMSSFQEGDPEFPKRPYQFRTKGTRSPESTFLLDGPNASLALLIQETGLSRKNAQLAQVVQTNFFSVNKAHTENVKALASGVLQSSTNGVLEKTNKHGFTMSWSPKILNKFFKDFIKKIEDEMDQDELEKMAKGALKGQKLPTKGTIKDFNGFWALPYIGFEDNLVRKKGEASTWFNEAQEKIYGGSTDTGGRWISNTGRVYTIP